MCFCIITASKNVSFQLRTDEERKEASEIVLAAIEMKSSIEPQWIGKDVNFDFDS